MATREELQERRKEVMRQALSRLSQEERRILAEVLQFESDKRHLERPHFKEPLKQMIEKEIHSYDTPVS